MTHHRRSFLKTAARFAMFGSLLSSGLLSATRAFAASWNSAAFTATTLSDALDKAGYAHAADSSDIELKVPEIAENGAVVPVEVTSHVPGTTSIAIFVPDNPNPLIAEFDFLPGALPYISTRIKMAKTSDVRIAIKAGDKVFTTAKQIKVTAGGCGG